MSCHSIARTRSRAARFWIDPYSSAAWFPGWGGPIRVDTFWKRELLAAAPPTVRAERWLVRIGWHGHGKLRFDEAPA